MARRGLSGQIVVSNATGAVSDSTAAAEAVNTAMGAGAQPVTAVQEGLSANAVTGQITIERGDEYEVELSASDVISGNTSVVDIEVFRTPFGGVAAAMNPAIRLRKTEPAAAARQSMGAAKERLRLNRGDKLEARVTSSVGTITLRQFKLRATQVLFT